MGWSEILHDSVNAVKDVLNDVKDKQTIEEHRAKNIEKQPDARAQGRAAANGTRFVDDQQYTPEQLFMYENPISYEDFIQTQPYRPLFEQYVQEYENEADPVMRMIISDKYLQSPLGNLPFPRMLINDMRKTDEVYANDPSVPRRYKDNIRNTKGIFDQQMTKFIRNV